MTLGFCHLELQLQLTRAAHGSGGAPERQWEDNHWNTEIILQFIQLLDKDGFPITAEQKLKKIKLAVSTVSQFFTHNFQQLT